MVQRGRVRIFAQRGRRRSMVWARDFNQTGNTSGLVIHLLAGFQSELGVNRNLPGMTFIRVVGTHDVRVVSTDDAFTRWVWGLEVAEEAQFPLVTNNPLSDPDRDWMFVRQEAVVQENAPDPGAGPDVKIRAAHYDLDLRSARKLDELGSTLFYVGDNPDGDNFDVNFQFNMLLKLP